MTRSDRTFPIGPRLLAFVAAVAALAVSVPGAGAQTGPSASDVSSAHQEYLAAVAEIHQIQAEIAVKQAELAKAVAQLDQEEAELEQLQAQIDDTRARIRDAQDRYDRIRDRLNERAAQAFMAGGGSNLEILLGATSLDDLSDRLAYVDAIARSDSSLAQQAANLRASLEFEEQSLEQLKAIQQEKIAAQQKVRDGILTELSAVNRLRDQAVAVAEQKLTKYQDIQKEHRQLLRALAQQTTTSPPHTSVDLPPGFHNPLEVCPVDDPRAFSDSFGAPRYAGGFHLHAGNDIVSNYGTPIRAPFDGTAKPSYNTLGGNSEYVYGATGYVYNAHLDHYAAKSNGPVQAGDIIGYVGDTGDAIGTPHDHFEWHPDVIPANWPASYYGYTVIGPTDAVNPYPILVDVCG
jgi:murein DD-endopeptidase MepM/ murein hydrolase activator NlpD